MIIEYRGRIFEPNSDGAIARAYIGALSEKFTLHLTNIGSEPNISYLQSEMRELLLRLSSTLVPCDTVVHHMDPPDMDINPGRTNIGVVLLTTDTIPLDWVTQCNKLDLIITPSRYSASAMRACGVWAPIHTIYPPIDTRIYKPSPALDVQVELPEFKFLSIFEANDQSNWVDICMSFLMEFTGDDPVVLIVKSISPGVTDTIANISRYYDNPPKFFTITSPLDEEFMGQLYSLADVLYLPCRGKGHSLPYMQAMACGTPSICTDQGPHIDHLTNDNAYLARSTVYPAAPDTTLAWSIPLHLPEVLQDTFNLIRSGHELDLTLPEEYTYDYASTRVMEAISEVTARRDIVDVEIPMVSIIILSYNNLPMLSRTMETLYTNTKYRNYETIIVENGSGQDDTELFEYLQRLECTVVYSEENLGFGGGNNRGTQEATGDILVFLNNDTEPQTGWLEAIVNDFKADDALGIVGSKLLFPNMTVQHVGIAFKQNGEYYAGHPLLGYPTGHELVNVRREQVAVTGACLSIRADLYRQLGGFDLIYERGYYEDSDLCMRARELDWKIICEPESVVIHKVGSSFGKVGALQELDFFRRNEDTFIDRWDEGLLNNIYMFHSYHHYAPGRMNIGILDSHMETYGGGEKMVVCTAAALEGDTNVDIITRLPNRVTRDTIYRRLGVKLDSTEIVTLLSAEDIGLYRDYDIFWNNEWRTIECGRGRRNILATMFPYRYGDLSFIDTYDIIIAISEYTRKYIGEYWGREADVLYPPVTMMATLDEVEELTRMKRNYVLTVGRFFRGEHCKQHGVMIEAFQKLEDPDWELHIVGGVSDVPDDVQYYEECRKLAVGDPRIVFHPNISYSKLRDLYRVSRIYWHATGYGATEPIQAEHFGITPVEAMSAGCYPILLGKGGLLELAPGVDTWNSVDELIDMTKVVMNGGGNITGVMTLAQNFTESIYMDGVRRIIDGPDQGNRE